MRDLLYPEILISPALYSSFYSAQLPLSEAGPTEIDGRATGYPK